MEHSKAQTALMARDAELERRAVEVAALQSDKAGLDKLLQVGQAWQGGLAWRVLGRRVLWDQQAAAALRAPLPSASATAASPVVAHLLHPTTPTPRPATPTTHPGAGEAVGDCGAADAAGGGRRQKRGADRGQRGAGCAAARGAGGRQPCGAHADAAGAGEADPGEEQRLAVAGARHARAALWGLLQGHAAVLRTLRCNAAGAASWGSSCWAGPCRRSGRPHAVPCWPNCRLPATRSAACCPPTSPCSLPPRRSWSARARPSMRSGARPQTPSWTCSAAWRRPSPRRSACRHGPAAAAAAAPGCCCRLPAAGATAAAAAAAGSRAVGAKQRWLLTGTPAGGARAPGGEAGGAAGSGRGAGSGEGQAGCGSGGRPRRPACIAPFASALRYRSCCCPACPPSLRRRRPPSCVRCGRRRRCGRSSMRKR